MDIGKIYTYPEGREAPTFKPSFMSDEVYGAVIANIKQNWTDMMPYHRASRSLILARRCIKPMHGDDGPWHFGGRMNIGENVVAAVIRHFKDDTQLDIPADRLGFIGVPNYQWHDRQQAPQDTPADGMAFTFSVELSDEEEALMGENLNLKEYMPGSVRRWTWDDLQSPNVHPVLPVFWKQIFG